jgi:hypothetical protein
MYGADALPAMSDQLWFSITMRKTVLIEWSPSSFAVDVDV